MTGPVLNCHMAERPRNPRQNHARGQLEPPVHTARVQGGAQGAPPTKLMSGPHPRDRHEVHEQRACTAPDAALQARASVSLRSDTDPGIPPRAGSHDQPARGVHPTRPDEHHNATPAEGLRGTRRPGTRSTRTRFRVATLNVRGRLTARRARTALCAAAGPDAMVFSETGSGPAASTQATFTHEMESLGYATIYRGGRVCILLRQDTHSAVDSAGGPKARPCGRRRRPAGPNVCTPTPEANPRARTNTWSVVAVATQTRTAQQVPIDDDPPPCDADTHEEIDREANGRMLDVLARERASGVLIRICGVYLPSGHERRSGLAPTVARILDSVAGPDAAAYPSRLGAGVPPPAATFIAGDLNCGLSQSDRASWTRSPAAVTATGETPQAYAYPQRTPRVVADATRPATSQRPDVGTAFPAADFLLAAGFTPNSMSTAMHTPASTHTARRASRTRTRQGPPTDLDREHTPPFTFWGALRAGSGARLGNPDTDVGACSNIDRILVRGRYAFQEGPTRLLQPWEWTQSPAPTSRPAQAGDHTQGVGEAALDHALVVVDYSIAARVPARRGLDPRECSSATGSMTHGRHAHARLPDISSCAGEDRDAFAVALADGLANSGLCPARARAIQPDSTTAERDVSRFGEGLTTAIVAAARLSFPDPSQARERRREFQRISALLAVTHDRTGEAAASVAAVAAAQRAMDSSEQAAVLANEPEATEHTKRARAARIDLVVARGDATGRLGRAADTAAALERAANSEPARAPLPLRRAQHDSVFARDVGQWAVPPHARDAGRRVQAAAAGADAREDAAAAARRRQILGAAAAALRAALARHSYSARGRLGRLSATELDSAAAALTEAAATLAGLAGEAQAAAASVRGAGCAGDAVPIGRAWPQTGLPLHGQADAYDEQGQPTPRVRRTETPTETAEALAADLYTKLDHADPHGRTLPTGRASGRARASEGRSPPHGNKDRVERLLERILGGDQAPAEIAAQSRGTIPARYHTQFFGQPSVLDEIKPAEVLQTLRDDKGGARTAPGASGVTLAMLKAACIPTGFQSTQVGADREDTVDPVTAACEQNLAVLAAYLDARLRSGHSAKHELHSEVVPIPKAGKPPTLQHWRPIALQDTVAKLGDKILARRLERAWMAPGTGGLTGVHYGFVRGRQHADAVQVMTSSVEERNEAGEGAAVVLADISAAYDSVSRGLLRACMRRLGTPATIERYVLGRLGSATASVRVGNARSAPFEMKCGLAQGSSLSPILWVCVCDTLLELLRRDGLLTPPSGTGGTSRFAAVAHAMADDVAFCGASMKEAAHFLHLLARWADAVQLKLSPDPRKQVVLANERAQQDALQLDQAPQVAPDASASNGNPQQPTESKPTLSIELKCGALAAHEPAAWVAVRSSVAGADHELGGKSTDDAAEHDSIFINVPEPNAAARYLGHEVSASPSRRPPRLRPKLTRALYATIPAVRSAAGPFDAGRTLQERFNGLAEATVRLGYATRSELNGKDLRGAAVRAVVNAGTSPGSDGAGTRDTRLRPSHLWVTIATGWTPPEELYYGARLSHLFSCVNLPESNPAGHAARRRARAALKVHEQPTAPASMASPTRGSSTDRPRGQPRGEVAQLIREAEELGYYLLDNGSPTATASTNTCTTGPGNDSSADSARTARPRSGRARSRSHARETTWSRASSAPATQSRANAAGSGRRTTRSATAAARAEHRRVAGDASAVDAACINGDGPPGAYHWADDASDTSGGTGVHGLGLIATTVRPAGAPQSRIAQLRLQTAHAQAQVELAQVRVAGTDAEPDSNDPRESAPMAAHDKPDQGATHTVVIYTDASHARPKAGAGAPRPAAEAGPGPDPEAAAAAVLLTPELLHRAGLAGVEHDPTGAALIRDLPGLVGWKVSSTAAYASSVQAEAVAIVMALSTFSETDATATATARPPTPTTFEIRSDCAVAIAELERARALAADDGAARRLGRSSCRAPARAYVALCDALEQRVRLSKVAAHAADPAASVDALGNHVADRASNLFRRNGGGAATPGGPLTRTERLALGNGQLEDMPSLADLDGHMAPIYVADAQARTDGAQRRKNQRRATSTARWHIIKRTGRHVLGHVREHYRGGMRRARRAEMERPESSQSAVVRTVGWEAVHACMAACRGEYTNSGMEQGARPTRPGQSPLSGDEQRFALGLVSHTLPTVSNLLSAYRTGADREELARTDTRLAGSSMLLARRQTPNHGQDNADTDGADDGDAEWSDACPLCLGSSAARAARRSGSGRGVRDTWSHFLVCPALRGKWTAAVETEIRRSHVLSRMVKDQGQLTVDQMVRVAKSTAHRLLHLNTEPDNGQENRGSHQSRTATDDATDSNLTVNENQKRDAARRAGLCNDAVLRASIQAGVREEQLELVETIKPQSLKRLRRHLLMAASAVWQHRRHLILIQARIRRRVER